MVGLFKSAGTCWTLFSGAADATYTMPDTKRKHTMTIAENIRAAMFDFSLMAVPLYNHPIPQIASNML
jgi:hypothetical protein